MIEIHRREFTEPICVTAQPCIVGRVERWPGSGGGGGLRGGAQRTAGLRQTDRRPVVVLSV